MKVINNEIYFGGLKATELADRYGTPLYVYEENEVKKNLRTIIEAIEYNPKRLHYALFSNNNIELLKLIRKAGASITTTSPGDVFIATKAGFLPKEIIFSGTNLNKEDFLFIKEKGIQINIDSLGQLEEYCKLYPKSKVGLRFNLQIRLPPEVVKPAIGKESRLGLNETQLQEAVKIASKYKVEINGLQTYLGSNVFEVRPFIDALKRLIKIAEKIDTVEYIDIGGGFPIDYSEKPKEFDWDWFGKEITKTMEDFSKNKKSKITLILEPGRSIMARTGTLLTRVVSIKDSKFAPEGIIARAKALLKSGIGIKDSGKTFIGTDTCFTHFMGQLLGEEHRIVKADKIEFEKYITADICGNTTLSTDFLGKNKKLPPVKKGDLLAILDVGAYGYALSNQFLSRPRPAEVLITGRKSRIIREREKFSDLL